MHYSEIIYSIDFDDGGQGLNQNSYDLVDGIYGPGLFVVGRTSYPNGLRLGDTNGGGSFNLGPVKTEAALSTGLLNNQAFIAGHTYTFSFDVLSQDKNAPANNQDIAVIYASKGSDANFDPRDPLNDDDEVLKRFDFENLSNSDDGLTLSWTPTEAELGGAAAPGYIIIARSSTGLQEFIVLDNLRFNTTVICYAAETRILTSEGERAAGDLKVGDRIAIYLEDVHLPILWINRRQVARRALRANPKLRPVRIMTGALGQGLPKSDLLVSRQHRILVSSKIVPLITGHDQVLVPAIKLVGLPGIEVDDQVSPVEYVHFVLERHALVSAEGAPAETLLVGPQACDVIGPQNLETLQHLFLGCEHQTFVPARPIVDGAQARKLIEAHIEQQIPVLGDG